MGPGRSHALLIALGLAGCHAGEPLRLPDLSDSSTLIWVSEVGGNLPTGLVQRRTGGALEPIPLADDTQLTLLAYREEPETLGLEEGALTFLTPPDGAPIQRPGRAYRGHTEDGPLLLAEITTDEAITGLRVVRLAFGACLAQGGCSVPRGDGFVCSAVCDPAPPAAPMPLSNEPCPVGFTQAGPPELGACAPPARVTCSPPQVQWREAVGCTPVGTPCPVAQFRPDYVATPTAPILYVTDSALEFGTGTMANPTTLKKALSLAQPGTTVLLADGSYTSSVTLELPEGVAVVGNCAADTRINSTADVAFHANAVGAELRDLYVSAARTAVQVELGADLTVRDMALFGGKKDTVDFEHKFPLIQVSDGRLRVESSLLDRREHRGITMEPRGDVTLERVVISGPADTYNNNLELRGGKLTAHDLVTIGGYESIRVFTEASASMDGLLVEAPTNYGTQVEHKGSLELSNAVFRGSAGTRGAHQLMARFEGRIVADHVLCLGDGKIDCLGSGVRELSDSGTQVSVYGLVALDARGAAVLVDISLATLSDVAIVGGELGINMVSASMVLDRASIAGVRAAGLCMNSDSSATIHDFTLDGALATQRANCGTSTPVLGGGVVTIAAADLHLTRARLENWPTATRAEGVGVSMTDTLLSHNKIGLQTVDVPDLYDRFVRVVFRDNDVGLTFDGL